jgi:predicted restriction endonuclease
MHGKVLALGRTRRLVSKALRRALLIRDRMCCYPGCHQTRHLKAHHVVPWILGGRTDLDNLILLCQWHHTAVHEGGITITKLKPTADLDQQAA